MSLHVAGDTVTVNGIAVKLTSWPTSDVGVYTWTQYLHDGGTVMGTGHTSNSTVVTCGAVAGTSAGLPATKAASHGHGTNNVGAK